VAHHPTHLQGTIHTRSAIFYLLNFERKKNRGLPQIRTPREDGNMLCSCKRTATVLSLDACGVSRQSWLSRVRVKLVLTCQDCQWHTDATYCEITRVGLHATSLDMSRVRPHAIIAMHWHPADCCMPLTCHDNGWQLRIVPHNRTDDTEYL
jgi:hypothetical protein